MSNRMLSMSALAEMTGFDRRTVKARLVGIKVQRGPKGALIYDASVALPALYAQEDGDDLDLQIKQETLRIERANAEKREIEVAQLRRELVPIEDVAAVVEKEYAAVRAAMLALPSKCSQELVAMDDVLEIKRLLEDMTNEALSELSADQRYAAGDLPSADEADNEPGVEGSADVESAENAQA